MGENILDHISESLETIFYVKILKFFDADLDPGSGNLINLGSSQIRNTAMHCKKSGNPYLCVDGAD
jgi:hypothetical protein